MRDAEMADLDGLPPYEPVAKTLPSRPVIVTLGRALDKHSKADINDTHCDAVKIDSTTEFAALNDTFIARVRRLFTIKDTDPVNGRFHIKLKDRRFINFDQTDTWKTCRDILLAQDETELWFTFWTQKTIKQEAATQQAKGDHGTGCVVQ
ncbi:hypothetical protein LTS10_010522 [Elasticomyces elasticus]|nr:hypothetical protein LTS10_010522 [Elasticomyces elasticus]